MEAYSCLNTSPHSLSFPELCAEVLALFVDQKGDLLAFLQRKQTQTPPSGLIVLAATSGDTGSAAIAALKSRSPLIHVVVLFPKGRTSEIQRLQMVTVQDPNIHCLQVNGTFDDCQRMVKIILSDKELQELLADSNRKRAVRDMSVCRNAITPVNGQPSRDGIRDSTQTTTSASAVDGFPECRIAWKLSVVNSINCVRILIQAAYWWYSALKMQHEYNSKTGTAPEMYGTKTASRRRCNIVVPTGNFGNIFSAFLAKQMGAPIGKLLLATNTNDVLCQAQDTGVYDKRRGVRATCSPSMDIAAASNFERLIFCSCGTQGNMPQIELTDEQRTQDLTQKQGRSLWEKSSLPAESQNKVPEHCLMGDANTPEDKRFESTSEERFRSSGPWSSTLRAVTERFDQDGYARLGDKFLSFYRNNFLTEAVDDAETTKAIEKMYRLYGEIVDPHTAVGYAAYLKQVSKLPGESQGFSSGSNNEGGQKDATPTSSDPWLLAATAHFGKFPETVLAVVGRDKVNLIPLELKKLKDMPQRFAEIGPSTDSLKSFIVEKFTSSNKQMLGIDSATMDGRRNEIK
ncbi:threonine synthase [Toxoplasma gondii GAB2-2007-GAL-DOM2]|uniref:Threonine synthase n=6 Tax=Toxoplasma gondii TaxID=5811 RepID=A0A125YLU3_TOXGV|nr:threonine synthase [Toxoplasma gondii GT1]ESS28278.1 threonine synthase [Toxoplasma gondii VEG]KFG32036.1 threonine synthase [Toxoplasma gondii FOU]KFG41330.1 threonine synthase [Toxoplasma gondii GAB2-2007-GAL-DOM2]KFH03786.1 threonine synthase [Toxoplasma gondii VAND]